jgi:hypothetical protein
MAAKKVMPIAFKSQRGSTISTCAGGCAGRFLDFGVGLAMRVYRNSSILRHRDELCGQDGDMGEGEGNQAWNIFVTRKTFRYGYGLERVSFTKVRPPGRETAEKKGNLNMKIRRMFLAVFALIVLGGLAVPANALGHHHHRHHHRHHKG